MAAESGPLELHQHLAATGADVNVRDGNETWISPIHYAALHNSPSAVRTLVEAGAEVNLAANFPPYWPNQPVPFPLPSGQSLASREGVEMDDIVITALHVASANDFAEVARVLIEAGADINQRSGFGYTPLHLAAITDATRVAQLLLDAGANVNSRDPSGETPIDDADGAEMRRMLLAAGGETKDERKSSSGDGLAQMIGVLGVSAVLAQGAVSGAEPDVLAEVGTQAISGIMSGQSPTEAMSAGKSGHSTIDVHSASGGTGCEIPGYPRPTNPQSLGLSWCPSSVDFQIRSQALTAAAGWCAIRGGTSSKPDQISARHKEIRYACDVLNAWARRNSSGSRCVCPANYRP